GGPRADPVVAPPPPPLLDPPRREQLVDLEPRPLAPGQHLVPRARRHPHAEPAQNLLTESAPRQILPRLLRLRRLPQVALVELRGPFEQLPEPRLSPPRLLRPRILALALELHTEPLG